MKRLPHSINQTTMHNLRPQYGRYRMKMRQAFAQVGKDKGLNTTRLRHLQTKMACPPKDDPSSQDPETRPGPSTPLNGTALGA